MSHLYRKDLQFADSPNLDAFGKLRVSESTSLIEVKHVYDKEPNVVSEAYAGTGATSIFDSTNSCINMSTTTSGDYVVRKSRTSAVYAPGKSQLYQATVGNFQLQTNVVKRVGYYSTTTVAPFNSGFDGFFLESNGITGIISFQIWKAGTQTAIAPLSSWSTDLFNPTSIDWTKAQLLHCDFQWLGAGRLRFGLSIGGVIYEFYQFIGANNVTDVYMQSPSQPIRYEIRQTGTGSGSMRMICSQVLMEGPLNRLGRQLGFGNLTQRTFATSGTKYPILGFRIGATYSGVAAVLEKISILSETADNYIVTVEMNPTLSATPTFSTIPNSQLEYAQGDGSQTITTDGFIRSVVLGKGGTNLGLDIELQGDAIKPGFTVAGVADQLWICITPLAANAKCRAGADIIYWV